MITRILAACILFYLYACSATKKQAREITTSQTPKAATEFRAAWVATVANINWPSQPGLSTEEQQKEAIALLDFLHQNHFNAVILQVRPQCDALYKSELEPWSYYLTGEQGKAPSPFYDPLEFWIEAAHDRGLELHVWLNPYRAHHKEGKEISEQSIIKKHPELVVYLKEGYWWLDPAKQGTQDHSAAVVMDLVKRYDIDGVHFDDYFYPYPSYNLNEDFPDSASWKEYRDKGGSLSRADWRREAVNKFIKRVYKSIKAEKPHVKFGLSPFGIWRPGFPESIGGFDQYEQLYADARLWLNEGWIDYFAPQLYWPINRMPQSFPVLLGWWAGENTKNRHLWPGISVGRDSSARNVNEILSQLMISRGMLPKSKGVIHWSISSLTRNPNMIKAIAEGPYKQQSLVPPSRWLDKKAPAPPVASYTFQKADSVIIQKDTISLQEDTIVLQKEVLKISWSHPDEKDVFRWIVYYKFGNSWNYSILNRKDRSTIINRHAGSKGSGASLNRFGVTAVDRMGNESKLNELVPEE